MQTQSRFRILFGFCLTLLLALVLVLGYWMLTRESASNRRQEGIQKATTFLQQGENLQALQTFLELERSGESSMEVQYGIFVSSYNLHYYSEALRRWSSLDSSLQDSLQPSVYYTLICFAHQMGDAEREKALFERAQQLAPGEKQWEEIRSGSYRVFLEEVPALQQGQQLDQSSDTQIQQAVRAYESGSYFQAVQIWNTLAGQVRLRETDFAQYAQACIAANDARAYDHMLGQARQQSVETEKLPQFWGNTPGNMLNGGIGLLVGDKMYFSAFFDARLSAVSRADWLQSEEQLATHLPLAIETVGERGAAYLNHRENALYFADPLNGWKLICRNLAPGKESEEVLLDQSVDQVLLAGSYLYFRDNSDRSKRVCRMDLQTRNVEIVVDRPVLSYTLDAQALYYIDQSQNHAVFRCKWDGSEAHEVLSTQTQELLSDGQHIVYVNTQDQMRIWIAGSEGENPQVLIDREDCGQLNWTSDGLLYFNHWTFQQLNLHTGEVRNLSEYGAEQINVVGDRILFANENFDYFKMISFPASGGVYQLQP